MPAGGVGLDLCSADRIRRVHERHGSRFLERVYTSGERSLAMRRRDPYPALAARWAAKEAVIKVLGMPEGFRWTDIEVVLDERGRPHIALHGVMLGIACGVELSCSISHEGDTAACVVLAREESR